MTKARRVDPLGVPCPKCHVKAGHPCRSMANPNHKLDLAHPQRHKAARA